MHAAGLSIRKIARKLEWGHGTVDRAIKNAAPPVRIIRGARIDGRPHVTIDDRPFEGHDAPDLAELSPTGRYPVGTFR